MHNFYNPLILISLFCHALAILPNATGILSLFKSPPSTSPSRYLYRQTVLLDHVTGLVLNWELDHYKHAVRFNISIANGGNNQAIILGFSSRGQIQGADFVVVGIGNDGRGYVLDMYGSGSSNIAPDTKQDWYIAGTQTFSHNRSATIRVSRKLATCDGQDVPFNNDMLHILWGYGDVDNGKPAEIEFAPQGSVRVFIVDPVLPPASSLIVHGNTGKSGVSRWRISRRRKLPARRTSYWCTIHRGLEFLKKQHIIGFTPYFGNEVTSRHVIHQMVYRCFGPPGVDPSVIFEKYTAHPGEECYLEKEHELPTLMCTEAIHTYGLGGKGFVFPDDIGIILGEKLNEYFMFETHYDNPELRSDITIENGVDFYYTSQLRPKEGGLIFVGAGVLGLYLAPPKTPKFNVAGVCSSECTRQMIPKAGVNILATMLHGHAATSQMYVRHFRGSSELPLIQGDGNYDFSYQQIRLLPKPAAILPGDQISVECVLNTSSRKETTLSGLSTQDEMCVAFILVDQRLHYLYCSSEYPTERTMDRYGIHNMTWDRETQERIVKKASDPAYVGLTLSQVLDKSHAESAWTPAAIQQLEKTQLFSEHAAACPPVQLMAHQAYAAKFLQGATGGVFNSASQIQNTRPTTKTISTPTWGNLRSTYPVSSVYAPPQPTCS